MRVVTQSLRSPAAPATVALVAAAVLAEFAIIGAFLLVTPLACIPAGLGAACGLISWAVASGASVIAFGALYLMARMRLRPDAGRPAAARVPLVPRLGWPLWPTVQIAGFLLVLLPLLVIGPDIERLFRFGPLPWIAGSLMATFGALLWLMPWESWRALLREDPVTPVLVVAAGLAAPTLFTVADRAWEWSPLSRLTFRGVAVLAQLFGTAEADPARYLITLDYFTVEIGAACSGIQGFALILALVATYFWIDRANLDFRRAWLLVPVALVLSFVLNVVRIVLLLVIGARFSPDLAVDGFHGHAGWLMFVLLGLPLVGVARAVPWFHAAPAGGGRRAAPPPLVQDEKAALILPFMALMFTSLLASTFALVPELWYPLRMVAVLAVLAPFLPFYSAIAWRVDATAVAAGLVVGLAWLLTQPAAGDADAGFVADINALPAHWLAAWVVFRVVGSVLIIPLVEEGFFRGYLLSRLDGPGWRRAAALLVSAGLFALFHERWLAGLLAGLVFGLAMLRRGRLADAVVAHAAANLVLAAAAVAGADWAGF